MKPLKNCFEIEASVPIEMLAIEQHIGRKPKRIKFYAKTKLIIILPKIVHVKICKQASLGTYRPIFDIVIT